MRVCRDGFSALMFASGGGHVSCVEALISHKADVGTTAATSKLVVLGIWCRLRHLLMHPSLAWAEADGGQIH